MRRSRKNKIGWLQMRMLAKHFFLAIYMLQRHLIKLKLLEGKIKLQINSFSYGY